MIKIGLDLGTKTLVCATREKDGTPKFKKEINGFFPLEKKDSFTKNMLIQQKIPFIEQDGKFVALGGKAEKLAYAVNQTLLRPMAEGTVSKEQEAIKIMASIIQAIIGKLDEDAVLYYSIPAEALNKATNVGFHDKIAKMIFDNYKRSDATIKSFPINEARAIAIGSELPQVIAISWGAGMVNACYTMFGMQIFEFSLVGSGDWIDIETSKQFGYNPEDPRKRSEHTPTSICHHKQKIDLSQDAGSASRVDQAIMLHYQLLIERVVNGISQGLEDNADKINIDEDDEIPIVMAGGTASPPGFCEYFKKVMDQVNLPYKIASVEVVDKPLYAVANGCLRAAEMHEE